MNFQQLFNKIKAIDEGKSVNEGVMSEVDQILQDVAAGRLDAYEIMSNPRTPAEKGASQIIQDMYETVAIDHRLHPDDDFEQILDIVADNLAQDYGTEESVNQGAVAEGDWGWDDPSQEPSRPDPDEDWEYEQERQRELDNEGVAEGDYGWDDPSQEPSRPEPDEDWEYEKRRQHEIDYPDSAPNFKYEPSEDELAAEKEEQARRNEKLKRVLAMMDKMYGKPKKREAVGESLNECGMPMGEMPSTEQQDSVSMNVSMNASGAGGIRNLMDILKNIDAGKELPTDAGMIVDPTEGTLGAVAGGVAGAAITKSPSGAMAGAELGSDLENAFSNDVEKEGFSNSPDEKYAPASAVTASGNDLNRSKRSYKHNPLGGDNKMTEALAEKLMKHYESIKNIK